MNDSHLTKAASLERDFGYGWTLTGWPRYRVSWRKETGELYAHNCSNKSEFTLAYVIEESLDSLMENWPEEMHKPNSLGSLRQRAADYDMRAEAQ